MAGSSSARRSRTKRSPGAWRPQQLSGKSNLLPADFRHLDRPSEAFVGIASENSRFLVNVLRGFGLANRNPVLETMAASRGGGEKLMGLASTGGWTLGAKPA